jgi:hypothetical protein
MGDISKGVANTLWPAKIIYKIFLFFKTSVAEKMNSEKNIFILESGRKTFKL